MKIPKILFKNKKTLSGIYCIENIKNNKKYVGSSKNCYQRLHCHRCYLNNKTHDNIKLQNSWNKHGEDNFICYLLESVEVSNLTHKEQYYIDLLKPFYNIMLKVERIEINDEMKDKISKTLKEGYLIGRITPTRTKSIKVYNLKGELLNVFPSINETARQLKIRNTSVIRCLSGESYQTKGYIFKYLTDESEVILKETTKSGKLKGVRKSYNERSKPLVIKDLKDNIIYSFKSVKDASLSLNINYDTIRQLVNRNGTKIYKNRYELLPGASEIGLTAGISQEDNQQPNISSNTFEGSETNSRIRTDNAEDSNANKNALHLEINDDIVQSA